MNSTADVGHNEISHCVGLIGFWLFVYAGETYLGVMEHDRGRTRTALVIRHVDSKGSTLTIRRIENDGVWVRALDARVFGDDLVIALELNRGNALQIVKAPVASLVSSQEGPVSFEVQKNLNLAEPELNNVHLPPSEQWNVAGPLLPKKWLFDPFLERGTERWALVVNSADGQAMRLSYATAEADWRRGDAATPQALTSLGSRYIAFQRFGSTYRPFWSLARYSGPAAVEEGKLWIARNEEEPLDISSKLGLGPITAFSLAADMTGQPWIFIVRRHGSHSLLTAIRYHDHVWTVGRSTEIDGSVERIRALYANNEWQIFAAVHSELGWSLRYLEL